MDVDPDIFKELQLAKESLQSVVNSTVHPDIAVRAVMEEFWEHFKTLTGKDGSGSFFSCSC